MSRRILAVDDSATMREMIAFTLRQDGKFEVEHAANGQEALERVASAPRFDLIITDINMPVMDGYTFTESVRKRGGDYAKVPILILTTEIDQECKNKGRNAGATGWITKPFSPQKLVEVVTKLCGEA